MFLNMSWTNLLSFNFVAGSHHTCKDLRSRTILMYYFSSVYTFSNKVIFNINMFASLFTGFLASVIAPWLSSYNFVCILVLVYTSEKLFQVDTFLCSWGWGDVFCHCWLFLCHEIKELPSLKLSTNCWFGNMLGSFADHKICIWSSACGQKY